MLSFCSLVKPSCKDECMGHAAYAYLLCKKLEKNHSGFQLFALFYHDQCSVNTCDICYDVRIYPENTPDVTIRRKSRDWTNKFPLCGFKYHNAMSKFSLYLNERCLSSLEMER